MNSIPATDDFDVAGFYIIAGLEKHGVVRGIDDGHVAQSETLAIDEDDRVGPAHSLFAGRIEDFVAVDDAVAGYCDVLRLPPRSTLDATCPILPQACRRARLVVNTR